MPNFWPLIVKRSISLDFVLCLFSWVYGLFEYLISAGHSTLCIENTRIITLSNTLFLGNSCTNGLLQKAAKSGNFPVVKFLQENGADVNATTRDDTNPSLVHAAREGFFRWSYLLYQIGIRQGFKVKCN